jgi:ADP-ribosylglycohydrolase
MHDDVLFDPEAQELLGRYALPAVAWPSPTASIDAVDRVRSHFRGCLLWGAVGDALGRPAEGKSPAEIRATFGPDGPTEYVRWRGWRGGPTGTITDDTQLTMEIARSIITTGGRFDPEDFSRRLVAWLPVGRGKGRATTDAVENLSAGEPWWRSGVAVNSAGNGAAMRAAPIGLVHALRPTPSELAQDAVLSSLPTHTHRVGVAGAIVIAAGVAWCLREALRGAGAVDTSAFLDFVARMVDGLEQAPTRERRPGGGIVRLVERVREIGQMLSWESPEQVFAYTHNGAFALESVPAALYCFLRLDELLDPLPEAQLVQEHQDVEDDDADRDDREAATG